MDIEKLKKRKDIQFIHSTTEQFFSEIQPTYVYRQSLRTSMPGCYTTMSLIKNGHMALENELYLTEKMLSVAHPLRGLMEYPQKQLDAVVEDLLNVEFHDVLPGSSIRAGEENGLKLLDHGLLKIERLKIQGFFACRFKKACGN